MKNIWYDIELNREDEKKIIECIIKRKPSNVVESHTPLRTEVSNHDRFSTRLEMTKVGDKELLKFFKGSTNKGRACTTQKKEKIEEFIAEMMSYSNEKKLVIPQELIIDPKIKTIKQICTHAYLLQNFINSS